MKKISYLILALGLLFGGVASAEIAKLTCRFVSGTDSDLKYSEVKIVKNSLDTFIVLDLNKKKNNRS